MWLIALLGGISFWAAIYWFTKRAIPVFLGTLIVSGWIAIFRYPVLLDMSDRLGIDPLPFWAFFGQVAVAQGVLAAAGIALIWAYRRFFR